MANEKKKEKFNIDRKKRKKTALASHEQSEGSRK